MKSTKGGILYILHSNSLLISNYTFLRNIAAKHGAAYLESKSSVSIDTSNFLAMMEAEQVKQLDYTMLMMC